MALDHRRPCGHVEHQHGDAGLQREGRADDAQADRAAVGRQQEGDAEDHDDAGDADQKIDSCVRLRPLDRRPARRRLRPNSAVHGETRSGERRAPLTRDKSASVADDEPTRPRDPALALRLLDLLRRHGLHRRRARQQAGRARARSRQLGPLFGLGPLAVEAGIFAFLLLVVTVERGRRAARPRQTANRLVLFGFVPLIVSILLSLLVLRAAGRARAWSPARLRRLRADDGRQRRASGSAGIIAYGMSQTLNVTIFAALKGRRGRQLLWLRAAIASVLSQIVDTLLFVTIAFFGVFPIGELLVGQMIAKVVLSAVLVPPLIYLFVATRADALRRRSVGARPISARAQRMTDHAPDPALLAKAETLTEALPYLQRYAGATFVVKYGGHAMGDPEAGARFRRGCRAAEGGRDQSGRRPWRRAADRRDAQAARASNRASSTACASPMPRPPRSPKWSWRARSTRKSSAGSAQAGGRAVGISGKDGGFVRADKVAPHDARSRFRASSAMSISASSASRWRSTGRIIDTLSAAGIIPVVAPIAHRRRRPDL